MRNRRKRLPAEERKKQILRLAVKVFARSNYRAGRVADIATEAGVSEAAVYKYFPSKKRIFLEILRHMSDSILLLWQQEVDQEEDALKAMRNMGITYFERMMRHPDELKVQFQAISEVHDKQIASQLRQDHQKYMRFIEKVIRKGIRQGTVRKDLDVPTMAFLFDGVGILMNMMRLLSVDRSFGPKRVRDLIDHVIASLKA